MPGDSRSDFREQFRLAKLGLHHPEPHHFIIPQCLKPKAYILWVVAWALFYVSTLSLEVYYNTREARRPYFIFLTNWSYILQAIVVFLDAGVTIYTHTQRKDIRNGECKTTTWYMRLLWVLFNVSNTVSVIVTLAYHVLLDPTFGYNSIYTHLLNSVYTILTLLFCAKPVHLLHVYQPIIYSVIYIIFSIIYHVTGNEPIYDVLNWDKTGTAVMYSCLIAFVGVPIVHVAIFAIYTLRLFVSVKMNCIGMQKKLMDDDIHSEVTSRNIALDLYKEQEQSPSSNSSNIVKPEGK